MPDLLSRAPAILSPSSWNLRLLFAQSAGLPSRWSTPDPCPWSAGGEGAGGGVERQGASRLLRRHPPPHRSAPSSSNPDSVALRGPQGATGLERETTHKRRISAGDICLSRGVHRARSASPSPEPMEARRLAGQAGIHSVHTLREGSPVWDLASVG